MGKEEKGTEKWDRKYKETKVKNGGTVATNGEGSGDCEIRVVIEESGLVRLNSIVFAFFKNY